MRAVILAAAAGVLAACALALGVHFGVSIIYAPVDPCSLSDNILWLLLTGCW